MQLEDLYPGNIIYFETVIHPKKIARVVEVNISNDNKPNTITLTYNFSLTTPNLWALHDREKMTFPWGFVTVHPRPLIEEAYDFIEEDFMQHNFRMLDYERIKQLTVSPTATSKLTIQ